MASSGIRRKVDDLGRVVIPAGMRRTLGIREGDAIEVSVEGERVVLAKPRDACVFCGREEEDLTGFRGRLVCRDCLTALGSVDERLRATATAQTPPQPATPRTVAQLPDWDAPSRTSAAEPRAVDSAGRRPEPRPRVEPPATPAAGGPPAAPATPSAAPPTPSEPPTRRGVGRDGAEEAEHDRPTAPAPEGEHERGASDERAGGDEAPDPSRRRRPPYDPASTTAW